MKRRKTQQPQDTRSRKRGRVLSRSLLPIEPRQEDETPRDRYYRRDMRAKQ